MKIKREIWLEEFASLLREGPAGKFYRNIGNGERIQVEFVSANPTGPQSLYTPDIWN